MYFIHPYEDMLYVLMSFTEVFDQNVMLVSQFDVSDWAPSKHFRLNRKPLPIADDTGWAMPLVIVIKFITG